MYPGLPNHQGPIDIQNHCLTITLMLSKALRLGMVLFQLVWLGALLPGHKRGQVTVPGSELGRQTNSDPCCHGNRPAIRNTTDKPSACTPNTVPDKNKHPGERASHCAICYIVATLQAPEPIDAEVLQCERVNVLQEPVPTIVLSRQKILAHHDRGPPAFRHFI